MAEMAAPQIKAGAWETAKVYVKGFAQGLVDYEKERMEEFSMPKRSPKELLSVFLHPEKMSKSEKQMMENAMMFAIPVGRVGAVAEKAGGTALNAAAKTSFGQKIVSGAKNLVGKVKGLFGKKSGTITYTTKATQDDLLRFYKERDGIIKTVQNSGKKGTKALSGDNCFTWNNVPKNGGLERTTLGPNASVDYTRLCSGEGNGMYLFSQTASHDFKRYLCYPTSESAQVQLFDASTGKIKTMFGNAEELFQSYISAFVGR